MANFTDPFRTADGHPVIRGERYFSHYLSPEENPVVPQEEQHSNFCRNHHTDEERTTTRTVGGGIKHPLCGCDGFVTCAKANGGTVYLDGTRLIKDEYLARRAGCIE